MRHLAAALALILCACAGSTTRVKPGPAEETPPLASYFPLEVGSRWTYQVRSGHQVSVQEVRIVDREGRYFVDDQGGALYFDGDGLRDTHRYLVLGPVRRGATWQSTLPDGRVERYEVLATDAMVQVPAGTFEDVIVVRATTPADERADLEIEWSWAPDVGLVRMTSTLVTDRAERISQAQRELLSHSLAD